MSSPDRDSKRLRALIHQEAAAVGLDLDDGVAASLEDFAALYLKWNERINLSSLGSMDELVERHFVDSYVATRLTPQGARLVDVGSGGGLPALPLALIRSDISVECFEPKQKKLAFLRTALRELGLGDRVRVHGRALQQPVPEDVAGRADVAMSRATLEPRAWLELGRALIRRDGGRVLVFTTSQSEAGLPPSAQVIAYGRNRRLHSFG